MKRLILAVALFLTACTAPLTDADMDATVNARVAGTLVAGQGGADDARPESGGADINPNATGSPPAPEPDLNEGLMEEAEEMAQGPGPNIENCPIFPADHILNTPINTLPVHPLSDQYIASIGADTALHPDFGAAEWEGGPIGIPYNVVDGSQITPSTVEFYYPDESDAGPYPIPPNPTQEFASDRHILIVDTSNCYLYEIYDASQNDDGSWAGGSGAIWPLADYALRPETWTSADAAGLPILSGLLRYDEIAAGEIRHAIRFTAEETQQAFVWPARHYASDITDTNVPPMGQRFRLRADFDISGYSPEVQVILRAMQVYGIILADNGSDWFINGAPDPRWNDEELHEAFDTISGSDFEAVDVSSLMIDPYSGQARQP